MLEKHAIPDHIIIKCLNIHYGIEVATLTFLPIGADTNASIYKAQTYDQTSYFIKLKIGHHQDIGIEIVELLPRARIHQIIPPVKTIRGQSTQPIDDLLLSSTHLLKGKMDSVAT